jgi:disulfide bond formation protein DsbB
MTIMNEHLNRSWQVDRALILVWFYSAVAIGCSFYQQMIQGIQPCFLCQLQRLPYFLIFCLAPFGFSIHLNHVVKVFIQMCLLLSVGLAFYHLLIQFEFITDRCKIVQSINSQEEFYLMLKKSVPSCSLISWKIAGFPVTAYNLLFSILILIYLIKNWAYSQHNKIEELKRNKSIKNY